MTSPLAILLGVGPLIGIAIARRFSAGGFRVAMVGRDEAWLAREAEALPGSRGFVADLAEAGAVTAVLQTIQAAMGDAEVLIYHASAGERGGVAGLDPARLTRDLRVNAVAPVETVQAVLPAMRRAGRGTILFTGGGLALKPQAEMASGCMGKAALRQLALCLAEELRPDGIHVATVTIAGFVQRDTPFHPDLIASHFWELYAEAPEAWRSEVLVVPPGR